MCGGEPCRVVHIKLIGAGYVLVMFCATAGMPSALYHCLHPSNNNFGVLRGKLNLREVVPDLVSYTKQGSEGWARDNCYPSPVSSSSFHLSITITSNYTSFCTMSSHEDLTYTPHRYLSPPLPDFKRHGSPIEERPLKALRRPTEAPNEEQRRQRARSVSLMSFLGPPSSWFSVSLSGWSLHSSD
jgi:hypothetical protein